MTERSKLLSQLLRHKPEKCGITLDKEGWAAIDQLVNAGFTRQELLEIVQQDSKQRFAISSDGELIRANQGHTTSQVKLTFKKGIPPVVLYHGTNRSVLPSILKHGIKPMERHHVHLSADAQMAREAGLRRKAAKRDGIVMLGIDAKKMLADGVLFFLSENGVWLVDHVDPKYINTL